VLAEVAVLHSDISYSCRPHRIVTEADGARSFFLEDRFGVDGDLNHVADDDATSVQPAVPARAEVVAIDRGARGKARPWFSVPCPLPLPTMESATAPR
jgi:hypothetical protein